MMSPVVLFVFNRPEYTARVFHEIAKSKPAKLLVVADGPRREHPDDLKKCAETRAIIEKVDWPCEVSTDFSETNLGCKRRVSSGLDWVFSLVEEAIILEDDCVPEQSFFWFCQQLLERYRDDTRVMHISGTNYAPDEVKFADSYCFSRYYAIWGWATWRRAWKLYDINMVNWEKYRESRQLSGIYREESVVQFFDARFKQVYEEMLDTWDIQWEYTCIFNNGLAVVPQHNLISNIGIWGTLSNGIPNCWHNMQTHQIEKGELAHPPGIFANYTYDRYIFSNFAPNTPIPIQSPSMRRCLAGLIRKTGLYAPIKTLMSWLKKKAIV